MEWGYMQGSQGEIRYRSQIQGPCELLRVICIYQWAEVKQCGFKRRCQLVVRVKANKCYQKLLCYLSSYINLLKIRLCGRLKAFGQVQAFSPWSRTHTGSRPLAVLILDLVFGQLFLGKVYRNPTAFKWIAYFVAIWLYSTFGHLIVFGLFFDLSLNRFFLTSFVCDFGPLPNCSRLFLALLSSCLSILPSNCMQL